MLTRGHIHQSSGTFIERLTGVVLAHKKLVVLAWIALTMIGLATSSSAINALDQRFSVPGREGWDANVEIVEKYGNGGDALPLLTVVELPQGASTDEPEVRDDLRRMERAMQAAVPGARVAGFGSTGDSAFNSENGRVSFAYAFLPRSDDAFGGNKNAVEQLEQRMEDVEVAGAPVRVTGIDALSADSGAGGGVGVIVELLIAAAGALVVLVLVFGSFLALAPLMMALCAIPVSFLLLYGLSGVTDLSPILQFLVPLIGLGISIDYALLIVVRWREERDNGLDNEAAVTVAMRTAGSAVVFSGTTVAIGLLALVVTPLPFLRSMGFGGLLIPLVATAIATTLLPVVLAAIGPAMDKRRVHRSAKELQRWERWSRWVVKRRISAAILAVGVLAALIIPATNLHLGDADPSTLAKSGQAKAALTQLEASGIGAGALAPTETLVRQADAEKVRAAQGEVSQVHGAVAPDGRAWRRGGDALVVAIPRQGDNSDVGRDTVGNLIDAAHHASDDARVGGSGPLNRDFVDAVYGSFPVVLGVIALLTFLLLARAFRSLLLPAKAVILNILSVGAAWGIMALVWQEGHGSNEIWGIAATGSIATWIPFMVFALLYGMSMDYEVFITSRIREEYDIAGETDEAVVQGLAHTGRLVTSASLILFFAFAALAAGPEVDIKVLATGLAAGILLDATIIRALLVPAIVSLFGRWNWYLPDTAAKLLRVKPSEELRPLVSRAGR
jgi:RND superfamily putative drug exporter